jgi:hypothetical protein
MDIVKNNVLLTWSLVRTVVAVLQSRRFTGLAFVLLLYKAHLLYLSHLEEEDTSDMSDCPLNVNKNRLSAMGYAMESCPGRRFGSKTTVEVFTTFLASFLINRKDKKASGVRKIRRRSSSLRKVVSASDDVKPPITEDDLCLPDIVPLLAMGLCVIPECCEPL